MTEHGALVEDTAEDGEPARRRWARRVLAGALALGLIAGGVGATAFTINSADDAVAVGAGPGPRKLTQDEAYRIAGMRYQNFRTQGVHVRAVLPRATGRVVLVGDVDYRRKVGFARVTGAGPASGVYQWTAKRVVTWPGKGGRNPNRPAKVPGRDFNERSLEPRKYPVDAVLTVLLQLGAAKPDNASKLRRSATFLRAEGIDGIAVDVIAGARRPDGRILNYWVDTNGRLKRVTTRLSTAQAITQIDLDPRAFRTFPRAEALTPKTKPQA